MQAVVNRRYGAPGVLQLAEVPRPRIGARQVLVRVHASTVTEGDRRLRAADYPGLSALFGRLATGLWAPRHAVGGSTFAGRVVEVGAEVSELRVGDDVFGSTMHGAYAEYLAVSVDDAVGKMPRGVDYGAAAAIPYGGVTALHFLRDLAKVQPGERVLILGASGGVGRIAVQLANHLGAQVTGVCSGDAAMVRALGADEVIDYRQEDIRDRAERWDVILDTTEGNHFRGLRAQLTMNGRYLSLYVTLRVLWQMAVGKLRGVRRGPRALTGIALGGPQACKDLRALVERGAIGATVARRFAMADTVAAHAYLEAERPHGSVVVDVRKPEARPFPAQVRAA